MLTSPLNVENKSTLDGLFQDDGLFWNLEAKDSKMVDQVSPLLGKMMDIYYYDFGRAPLTKLFVMYV